MSVVLFDCSFNNNPFVHKQKLHTEIFNITYLESYSIWQNKCMPTISPFIIPYDIHEMRLDDFNTPCTAEIQLKCSYILYAYVKKTISSLIYLLLLTWATTFVRLTEALGTEILSSHEKKVPQHVYLRSALSVLQERGHLLSGYLPSHVTIQMLRPCRAATLKPDRLFHPLSYQTWLSLDPELAGFKNSARTRWVFEFYSPANFFSYVFTVFFLNFLLRSRLLYIHEFWLVRVEQNGRDKVYFHTES